MTDPTVLADALVDAGIGVKSDNFPEILLPGYYAIDTFEEPFKEADEFITDWRVAGKVLELMLAQDKYSITATGKYIHIFVYGKQVATVEAFSPRAIIEAWYAAQEEPK